MDAHQKIKKHLVNDKLVFFIILALLNLATSFGWGSEDYIVKSAWFLIITVLLSFPFSILLILLFAAVANVEALASIEFLDSVFFASLGMSLAVGYYLWFGILERFPRERKFRSYYFRGILILSILIPWTLEWWFRLIFAGWRHVFTT